MRVLADADEVDVGRAVDLSAREKEGIDATLPGAVEQLAPAVGEEALPAAAQQRHVGPAVSALTRQQCSGSGNRRGRADRHVARIADQAGDDVGEQLLVAVSLVALKHVGSSRFSFPGLTPPVGLARLAAGKSAELGKARVPVQSIQPCKTSYEEDGCAGHKRVYAGP